MPPKAKGKSKKSAGPEKEAETPPVEVALPTERELQLKSQLESITVELKNTRLQVEELKHENDFLQQEAQQIRVETHEYLTYVSKKSQKRQAAVISLSDRNTEKIHEIQAKKEEAIYDYDKQKEELSNIILNKEAELTNIRNELSDLHEYQVLQEEQEAEILTLEKRMAEMRIKHNEAVQKLKGKFLEDKNSFQKEAEEELKELSKEAKKDAHQCLQDHSVKIKFENRALRKELLELIQKTRALHKHKLDLEEQRKILIREQEYAKNLQKIRINRFDNMHESHGVVPTT